ncbi:MAG: prepilin peptidase [Gammaproteobacteria bacterium]|jgi:leader peptidase (prepilin peptidase) / N-methyltransferase|nr:prepilin peptidase [Gammaproteobacteria bacterium]MBT7308881.1 prepilin peptidase [Gammaproteobacteria bacterium]
MTLLGTPITADLFLLLAILFGAIAGSFLSMLVYRLPQMMETSWKRECQQALNQPVEADTTLTLSLPNSFCPHCHHPLRLIDNLPVFGFLFNRGRCHFCHHPIGWRYITLELLSILIAITATLHWGPTPHAMAAMLFGWLLLALLFIDLEHRLLPDLLTQILLWSGLIINQSALFALPSEALWGAIAGYLILWSLFHLHYWISGREGIGRGDFKLLAALGGWCGWTLLPQILLTASVSALLITLPLLLIQRSRNRDTSSLFTTAIPFGPFLAIGGWVSLFWGERLNELLTQGLSG